MSENLQLTRAFRLMDESTRSSDIRNAIVGTLSRLNHDSLGHYALADPEGFDVFATAIETMLAELPGADR